MESGILDLAPVPHTWDADPRSWRLSSFLGETGWADLRADVATAARVARRVAPRWLATGRHAWWTATGAPLTLALFHWHARRGRGVSRVVDKAPAVVGRVDLIRSALPSADLLYIHRDPGDVYASYRRRVEVDPSVVGTFGLDPEAFERLWRRRARAALDAARDDRVRLHLVAYDDLVTRPEATLRRVCEAIDVDYDPGMLDLPDPALTDFAPDPHVAADITPDPHRHSDWVDDETHARLRNRLRPEIEALRAATPGP